MTKSAILFLAVSFGFQGCANLNANKQAAAKWQLVWSDEFNIDGAPDKTKWRYEEGFVRNEELQYYTVNRRENVRVEKGSLVIEARPEKWPNPQYETGHESWQKNRRNAAYTSGALETYGLAEWTYGKFEVRAKVPGGRGTWPAAWMLGSSIYQGTPWPLCGEIDIMEYVGYLPKTLHQTVHTQAFNHTKGTQRGASREYTNATAAFHTYTVEWDKDKVVFSIDGDQLLVFKNDGQGKEHWPFDAPHFILLNYAMGGAWGGVEGIDPQAFPSQFLVDWVRVYQKTEN